MKLRASARHAGNGLDEWGRVVFPGEHLQAVDGLRVEECRDDDPACAGSGKLRVHQQPRKPAIAVCEWVNLDYEEGIKNGAGESLRHRECDSGALLQGTARQTRGDKLRRAGVVALQLERAGVRLRPAGEHQSVSVQQAAYKCRAGCRQGIPVARVRRPSKYTQNVSSQLTALRTVKYVSMQLSL